MRKMRGTYHITRSTKKRQGYGRKQNGFGSQTKSIFKEKAKTTEKIILKTRLFCSQPQLKRYEHFELRDDAKRMGQMIRVNITLRVGGFWHSSRA